MADGTQKRVLVHGIPDDKTNMVRMFRDGQYIDLWMSMDMWFNPIEVGAKNSNLPKELVVLLDRWKKEVEAELPSFKASWYEKYASLKFIFGGEFYRLLPCAIGSTPEHFSRFSVKIENELCSMGCPYTQYTGMLD